ncbi:hypothetical protein GW17_00029533 [Ensete ventricosum]|nr:hypothetical protein GW17_00029533 [Ensete ventricosum]RZR90346.1 hypothetical protein BHM03_00018212 [Ensete ventricosum]
MTHIRETATEHPWRSKEASSRISKPPQSKKHEEGNKLRRISSRSFNSGNRVEIHAIQIAVRRRTPPSAPNRSEFPRSRLRDQAGLGNVRVGGDDTAPSPINGSDRVPVRVQVLSGST